MEAVGTGYEATTIDETIANHRRELENVRPAPEGVPKVLQVEPMDQGGNKVGPFVVYFPTGYPFSEDQPTGDEALRFKWRAFKHPRVKEAWTVVAAAEQENLHFIGRTHVDNFYWNIIPKGAVATVDMATGKMRVWKSTFAIRMEPRDPDLPYNHIITEDEVERVQQHREYMSRLVEKMGSGRRKRQKTAKAETAIVAEDMDGTDYVQGLIDFAYDDAADTNMTRAEIMQRANAVRHLPPVHPDATRWQDAYKLEEFIPFDCYTALNAVEKQLTRAMRDEEYRMELMRNNKYHDYVLDMLPKMKDLSEQDYAKKIHIVAYLGVCINMWNGPKTFKVDSKRSGIARHLAERYDFEEEFMEHLLARYYAWDYDIDGTTMMYTRVGHMFGLLLLMTLAVAVINDEGEMPPHSFDGIRRATHITAVDLAPIFREIGAVVKPSKVPGKWNNKTFTVALLPDVPGEEPKMLKDYFPALRIEKAKKR